MTQTATRWWLANDLSDIYVDGHGSALLDTRDQELIARAEKSFAHAEHRLDNHKNEYDRIDAVLALKRAMDTRLEHLNSIYQFTQHPNAKSHGWLAVLESWGFVKQRTLRRIRRLRNAVEHDGVAPPDLDECEDYREVTWWFLRGTLGLLTPVLDFDFELGDSGKVHGSCDLSYNPLQITLTATVTPEMLSDSPLPGWIEMETLPALALRYQGKTTPVEDPDTATYYLCAKVTDWASVQPFLGIAMEMIAHR
ncbi:hypothetical protein [Streptomyces sp. WAC 04229]|uniref:hypothetical protein n=1 Tax=Streptomyces sp. WAC 04229 TaxID=2203206 RepID=UPI003D73977B